MVLGLGSRSKKDRGPSSSGPRTFDLDIHLHEIKPWFPVSRSSKAPPSFILRWSRGEVPLGNSKPASPKLSTPSEAGKIAFNETLQIGGIPFSHGSKKSKKPSGDPNTSLLFSLLDANHLKRPPLAQTGLALEAFAMIEEPRTISVPLSLSKKVSSKGAISYLHLTVECPRDDRNSGPAGAAAVNGAASYANSTSSRTSDASTPPPLDEETQQSLVAALLSDEDEDVASFTDDDDVSQGSAPSQENAHRISPDVKALQTDQSAAKPAAQEPIEKPSAAADARVPRPPVSAPQALPVKAAAIAAAAAYVPKRSFLSRDPAPMMDTSYDSYSDPDSLEDDGVGSPAFRGAQSPYVPAKSPVRPSHSQLVPSSTGPTDQVTRGSGSNSTKAFNDEHKADPKPASEKKVFAGARITAPNSSSILEHSSASPGGTSIGHTESTSSNLLSPSSEAPLKVDLESNKEGDKTKSTTSKLVVESRETPLKTKLEQKAVLDKASEKEKVSQKNYSQHKGETMRTEAGFKAEHLLVTDGGFESKTFEARSKGAAKVAVRSPANTEGSKIKASMSPGRTRETEEWKLKVASWEAKAAAAEARVQQLEMQVEKLKGELRDVAAVEAALYSATAEHGSSSLKVYAPARRLARMYIYASKHWSQERRASCAKNMVAGLVLVARACGNDVPRLTFWWSNVAVLRETVSMTFNVSSSSPKVPAVGKSMSYIKNRELKTETRQFLSGKKPVQYHSNQPASPAAITDDWTEPNTFTAALKHLEAWIYTKVVESVWWQILTLQMQKAANPTFCESNQGSDTLEDSTSDERRNENRAFGAEFEDGMHKNLSVDIWKKAFSDAYERMCPVRGMGVECGCLPMLNKMVLEECVVRLDVAMFNAILRDDEAPTDPVSDPISDARALPISTDGLSFGQGAQLKNAVATLSSWITNLLSRDGNSNVNGSVSEDDEKHRVIFPLLKAMGGLLMLPKHMLIDKSLRREVCPTLSVPFIARILSKFKPDEFSPEPVTPELLQTLNLEIAAENRAKGENEDENSCSFRIAAAPPVVYSPPQCTAVRQWIGEPMTQSRFGRSNSCVLKKGHTSDDEIDELDSPISWLVENTMGLVQGSEGGLAAGHEKNTCSNSNGRYINKDGTNYRFQLLREVWNTDSQV